MAAPWQPVLPMHSIAEHVADITYVVWQHVIVWCVHAGLLLVVEGGYAGGCNCNKTCICSCQQLCSCFTASFSLPTKLAEGDVHPASGCDTVPKCTHRVHAQKSGAFAAQQLVALVQVPLQAPDLGQDVIHGILTGRLLRLLIHDVQKVRCIPFPLLMTALLLFPAPHRYSVRQLLLVDLG